MKTQTKAPLKKSPSIKTAPGPPGLPIVGNYLQLQRKGQLLYNYENWRRYGDIVRLQLGPYTIHMLGHPDHIRHVLIENRKSYSRGRGYEVLKILTGTGLLTSEGDFWERQRRLIQPFFTPKAVPKYAATVVQCAERMLEQWETYARQGRSRNINEEMLNLALNIIGRTMLSIDLEEEAGGIARAFLEAVAFTGERITAAIEIPLSVPTPANLRFRRAVRMLDWRIYSIIDEHRMQSAYSDLLSKLVSVEDPETGESMSTQQIRDEMMTIFFAGHETIAQTLTWAWYLLSKHPEVEEQMHAELSSELGGRSPGASDLPRLPYTRMVVEETMRLYPAVWAIPRGSIEEDEIGGYNIPAGSMVFPAPFIAHRHPDFWEHPGRFDPSRFEKPVDRTSGVYLPFGMGPRLCIGHNFAIQEAILVLATVAQRFRLRLLPLPRVVPHSAITLSPRYGMQMSLLPRRRAA